MATASNVGKCTKCGKQNISTARKCTVCSIPLSAQPTEGFSTSSLSDDKQAFEAEDKPSKNMLDYVSPLALAVQFVGAIVLLAGVFLWCGNVFGFFPTFSLAGYMTGVAGFFILSYGFRLG